MGLLCIMNKLPVYVSESDFETYILPNLTHKISHNRLKVSYHYIFNLILYVLKSGCSWRTLRPENQIVTWQNIYYHYAKWSADGSFTKLFEGSTVAISDKFPIKYYEGEKLAIFNEAGFLEIAIFRSNPSKIGSANSLLGLSYRDVVLIQFKN